MAHGFGYLKHWKNSNHMKIVLLLLIFSKTAAAIEKGGFVCVEPRSQAPFVVTGTLSENSKLGLDELIIERVKQSQNGEAEKTLWLEKAHGVIADANAHSDSWAWKNSTAYKIDAGGKLSEAVFYLPPEMRKNQPIFRDFESVVRSRLKVKLKSGELYDLRLECSRSSKPKSLDSFL